MNDNERLAERVEKDEIFKAWKEEHKDSYLVHIFIMDEPGDIPENYCVGYYNKDDTITTFEVAGEHVRLGTCEEVFKKDEEAVRKLDLEKGALSFSQIKKIISDFREREYKREIPNKHIFILQHIAEGIVWNVTVVTAAFNTLNMKIDASTGEVLDHKLASLMSMGEFVK